mmetsp:Transcript_13671/g.20624  ORF Transcript_13671/g.20624 Transcript_13671/m.20624 type:complete len:378 (+) Transcript_13671:96-1229(+)
MNQNYQIIMPSSYVDVRCFGIKLNLFLLQTHLLHDLHLRLGHLHGLHFRWSHFSGLHLRWGYRRTRQGLHLLLHNMTRIRRRHGRRRPNRLRTHLRPIHALPRPFLRLPLLPQRRIQHLIHRDQILTRVPPRVTRGLGVAIGNVHAEGNAARGAHPRRVAIDGLPGTQTADEPSLLVPQTVPPRLVYLGDAHRFVIVIDAAVKPDFEKVHLVGEGGAVLAFQGPHLLVHAGSDYGVDLVIVRVSLDARSGGAHGQEGVGHAAAPVLVIAAPRSTTAAAVAVFRFRLDDPSTSLEIADLVLELRLLRGQIVDHRLHVHDELHLIVLTFVDLLQIFRDGGGGGGFSVGDDYGGDGGFFRCQAHCRCRCRGGCCLSLILI